MPKISIIVPVYNVENYLKKCVDTILSQTFTDFELILVDDGSTDNSGKICDEYKNKDFRIRVIHKENGGLSSARNIGIASASGTYVGFIDSDDYIDTDMYECLYNGIVKNNADIAVCGIYDCYVNKIKYPIDMGQNMIMSNSEALKFILNGRCLTISAVNKLYKRELFNNLQYPEGKLYEDAFITPILVAKSTKIVYIAKPKYCYMHRPNSITTNTFDLRNLDIIDAYKSHIEMVKEQFPEALDYLKFRIFWAYFIVLEKIILSSSDKYSKYEQKIIGILRKNIGFIFGNNNFTLKRKLMALLLYINKNLYKQMIIFIKR